MQYILSIPFETNPKGLMYGRDCYRGILRFTSQRFLEAILFSLTPMWLLLYVLSFQEVTSYECVISISLGLSFISLKCNKRKLVPQDFQNY